MSEQDETTNQPPVDDAPAPARRKSRGLAVAFVALLSLASIAAAGYLYWRVEGIAGSGGIESRQGDDIARLEREVVRARSMTRDGTDEMQASIAELEQTQAAHGESLKQLRTLLPTEGRADRSPDPKAWRLAEVEYLLRIANNRLLMERDTRAADQMLETADAILEELDDYALHDVRALLAEERMALANTKTANAQSIFLTLEAIKDALPELPLKQPEYFELTDASGSEATEAPLGEPVGKPVGEPLGEPLDETPTASGAEPDSIGEALKDRFFGLFEFRTRESVAPRPLIRPEEAIYLELNLRLALERAQLAMLRGNQTLFATSLKTAREWLDEYVDPEHAATQRMAQDLARLASLDIEQPMPDISGSLARLLELQRLRPDPAPAPPVEPGPTE